MIYILNKKRVNIYAPYTDAKGVTYANLTDPELRKKLKVKEVVEPEAPEDYSKDYYYRTESDEAPYVIYTRKSDEQIAQLEQSKTNAAALHYLTSTDWYVTRFAESGKAIPDDVKQKRDEARASIVIKDQI